MGDRSRDEATERLDWGEVRPRLIAVWSGGSALRPLPDEGTLIIGRGAECDVRIDHGSVSRSHAALRVHGRDAMSLEDLGSSNGTRIRGQALEAGVAVRLSPADIVEVGAAKILLEWPAPAGRDGATSPADSPMAHVERLVRLVAPSDISVLLFGETGAGKEVVAERIHGASPRSRRPMMRINCASLSDALLESELFGHERGAFTGAVQTKVGLLEAASGGTVLLDEVGELPLTTQAKLLRALETHELLRVGGIHPRAFDVRFIAASNRDLRAMCDRQAFRSDLYFRLNGITIVIPPLRERVGEVRALVAELIARQCAATARTPPTLTPQAVAHLERYDWPGNVRELRNVIERALVLCPGPIIGPEHLALDTPVSTGSEGARLSTVPPPARSPAGVPVPPEAAEPQSLKQDIGALERQRIVEALAQCGGNQTKAARILGISRRTLLTRLDAWGLPRPRK